MTYRLYNVPKYRTYLSLGSEVANIVETEGNRTNIYNVEVRLQRCFFVRRMSSSYAESAQ